MSTPPTAILCTISAQCVKDQPEGYRSLVEGFKKSDGDNAVFFWRMSSAPRAEVQQHIQHIYFVIGNKIRWRARVLEFQPGGEMTFDNGRTISARAWCLCYEFEQLPRPHETRRGFQGLRYYEP